MPITLIEFLEDLKIYLGKKYASASVSTQEYYLGLADAYLALLLVVEGFDNAAKGGCY